MTLATLDVEFTVCGGRDIPTRHNFTGEFKKIRYYVVIHVGDQSDMTSIAHVSKRGSPTWDDKFIYNVCKDHQLFLELYCTHDCRRTHRIGFSNMIDILSLHPSDNHEIQLYNKRGVECGTISMRLQILMVVGHHPANPISNITQRYSLDRIKKLGVIVDVLESSRVESMPPAWTNLLFSLGTLVNLAKTISQIDPKARLAVSTFVFAFEMAVQQCVRDQRVDGLIEMMATIYRLIMESEPLEKIRSFRITIERLLDATKECALFVADYCKTKKFTVRAVLNVVSNVDFVLESFEKTFATLRMEFVTTSSLHTTINTVRILENVEDIAKDVRDINVSVNLPTMKGASWNPYNTCLPGSQTSILSDITSWAISQRPEAPIYLLVGPAGCGKTCIANSIAAMFDNGRRLGASVFFNRSGEDHANPTNIFSSIARELAAFDDKLKIRISNAISKHPCLGTAVFERQLPRLIIEPLTNLTIIGPIVVIIDGLDACKDRNRILSLLRNATDFPPNLRILVTTRPEDDILASPANISQCYQRYMTADEEGLIRNVPLHSYRCLQILQDIRPTIFADSSCGEVTNDFKAKSLGVFLWISVAIRFLAIVSDDTARAFLSEISSVDEPQDYAAAMSILEHAIYRALTATSPVRLKSKLSIGGAMALSISGLRSDKTEEVLKKMFDEGLLNYSDSANRFLSSIWHPGSRHANATNYDRPCAHMEVQDTSKSARLCMAHVCIDFLDTRFSSDVCSRTYQVKHGRETMINPHLRGDPPVYVQNYIDEAYQYTCKFWIDHLADAQDCCDVPLLKNKIWMFSKHFVHLLEIDDKNERKTNVLEKFLVKLDGSKVYDSNLEARVRGLIKTVLSWDNSHENLRRKGSTMERQLSKRPCLCPLYRLWKVASPTKCSFKASIEYVGIPKASLQCLLVSPPIMPIIDKDGEVHRAVREVTLSVDRTASGGEQPNITNSTEVGIVITRPNNGILPEWAKKGGSPIYQRNGIADMMAQPWLWPPPGEEESTTVDWEGDFDVDYQSDCPALPGDRLGIVARFARLGAEVSIKFSVTLEVEYECGQE